MNSTIIYKIKENQLNSLVEKWVNTKPIPHELFLCETKNTFVALDNTTNDCFVEEFDSHDKCICWLLNKGLDVTKVSKIKNIKRYIDIPYILKKYSKKELEV